MLAPRKTGRRPEAPGRGWLALVVAALLATALLVGAPSAFARPSDPRNPTSSPPATSTSTPPSDTTGPTSTPPSDTSGSTSTSPTTTSRSPSSTPSATSTSPSTSSANTPDPDPDPDPDPGPGSAPPPPFSEVIQGAAPGQEALAEQAIELSMMVVETTDRLAQLELEAEAAADSFRQAQTELEFAQQQAQETGVEAERAKRELAAARAAVGAFARSSYISGSTLSSDLLLLDATSPAQLIERAGLLESVADSRLQALSRVQAAQARSDAAEAVAGDALGTKQEAESAAQSALDESTALLDEQQTELDDLLVRKADYDAQFYASLVELVGPEGAAAAFAAYEQDQFNQDALEAAARQAAYGGGPVLSGRWALPLRGTLTSCYCERWGTMHWGIDIAAPMYTPEYAAGDGTVIQAGPATGFGQAVYIQHDNGDVTVYGHMEVIEVVTGQRVAAGQEIALVGTRGFSTGPHLHFEVHVGGINGTRVDPVIWLANRGIYV